MLLEGVSRLHARNLLLANEAHVYYGVAPMQIYTAPMFKERLAKCHWENLNTLPRVKVRSATSDSLTFTNGNKVQLYKSNDVPTCWIWCDDDGHAGVYMEWTRKGLQVRFNFYVFTQTLSETEFQKFRGVSCLTSTN